MHVGTAWEPRGNAMGTPWEPDSSWVLGQVGLLKGHAKTKMAELQARAEAAQVSLDKVPLGAMPLGVKTHTVIQREREKERKAGRKEKTPLAKAQKKVDDIQSHAAALPLLKQVRLDSVRRFLFQMPGL